MEGVRIHVITGGDGTSVDFVTPGCVAAGEEDAFVNAHFGLNGWSVVVCCVWRVSAVW